MRSIAKIVGFFAGSLFLVSLLIFGIIHLTPGDIAEIHNLSPSTAHQLYLDRPMAVQYFLWLKGCLTLDFGISMVNGAKVSSQIAEYMPPTLLLTFGSLFLSLLVSIPLGVYRGLHPVSPLGKFISLAVYTLSSIPVFVLGYIVLAVVFGVFRFYVTTPPEGPFRFWPYVGYYSLPIFVLAVGNGTIGEFVRFISLEVQNVNGAMFIKAARARGSSLWRHFFRSMVLPIFNIIVTNMAVLLGGLVVVERIFNFHGLGWLSWEATLKRDFSVIMGITLVMAFLIRVFMLANDLLAVWLDPRMRE
ncbi:MAG TPA: ABC transporter permease [Fibrobacteria bacterium]|nr:ABC transporter permease [Fibrobacteria bacterium]